MKRQLKRAAENVVASLAPLVWRVQSKPRLLVLMYHRVLPPEHPDRQTEQPGMYVSPQTLAMHIDVLRQQGFGLVLLEDWLEKIRKEQPVPRLGCALTFDDGWRDNYDHAYPILKAANAPATIYLVSDLVGTRYSFWPNSLARVLAKRGMDAQQIDATIMEYKATRSDSEMLDLVQSLEESAGIASNPGRDLMSWAEIEEMKSSGLVRFGSHTRRHTRLSAVSSAEVLQDEIVGSREAIERQLGARPKTFCYPNGDTSDQSVSVVRSAYKSAVTTQKGWHLPHEDSFLIRRIGVHEDISSHPAAFLARISGWL